MRGFLREVYERLYAAFGPQGWWPGDTPLEVAVGAVLTQNTNWSNVERAIANLKGEGALSARGLKGLERERLASLIRPAGYFNVKARRLSAFVDFLFARYGGSMKKMARQDALMLRRELIGVHGIGPETADSILLYALGKPVFVIDAYTRRALSRHIRFARPLSYDCLQGLFHGCFDSGSGGEGLVGFFNEYHALFVALGKAFCRPLRPLCPRCPLQGLDAGPLL